MTHPQPAPALNAVEPELDDQLDAPNTSWPSTYLVSAGFLGLLTATLALPLVAASGPGPQMALSIPALFLSVAATRWAFGGGVSGQRAPRAQVLPALLPALLGIVGVTLTTVVLGGDLAAWPVVLGAYAATTAVLVAAHAVRSVELRYLAASRRVYLVAREDQIRDVRREVRRTGGISVVGTFDPRLRLPRTQELEDALAASGATMLVLSGEAIVDIAVCEAAARFNVRGGRVRDLGGFYGQHFRKIPLSELTPSWFLFDIAEIHRPRLYGLVKRAVETVGAAALLLLLSPLMLVIAAAIRLTSRGPAFYRQQRIGHHDVAFSLVKFRSMRPAPASADASWAGADTHRVTRIGVALRRTRLDELPQLWNIFLGDMSFVGPRPEQVPLVQQLEQQIPYYRARHSVRPGLTGWAQVNYGYGGSSAGTIEKLQYDLYYVRYQGFRLDMLTVLMTLRAVVHGGS